MVRHNGAQGTPQPVVQWVKQNLAQVLNRRHFQSAMTGAGLLPLGNPDKLAADLVREQARLGQAIARSGIKI